MEHPNVVLTMLTGTVYTRILVLHAPLDEQFLDQVASIVLDGVMEDERKR